MEQQINKINADVQEMKSDVQEIKVALLGNDFNKKGLVEKIKDIEKYQDLDRKAKWMIAGGGVVIGVIYKIWENLY